MEFKTRYDYQYDKGEVVCDTPTMTQQHFKDECDINSIISRYNVTGYLPESDKPMQYGDFTNVSDFMTAQNIIIEAQERFDALPSDVRKRFDNNPANLLEFMQDDSNREEAIKLGLINNPDRDIVINTPDTVLDVSKSVPVEKTVETVQK